MREFFDTSGAAASFERVCSDFVKGRMPADGSSAGMLDRLPSAIYLTDVEGTITYYNSAALLLWGRAPLIGEEKWSGAWKLFATDGQEIPFVDCPMAQAVTSGRAIRGREIVVERPDGTRLPCLPFPTPLHDSAGRMIGAINMLVDISDRKQAESRISYLAEHDPLTGLPNRAAMQARVERMIDASGDAGAPFVLLAMDLRKFRNVKDVFGHVFADGLLREFAEMIREASEGMMTARFGFDEFLVLCAADDPHAAAGRFVKKINLLLSSRTGSGGSPVRVEPCFGAATYPQDGADFETLFTHAAAALYRAKKAASPEVHYFDAVIHRDLEETRTIVRDLDAAVRRRSLLLHYQPKFRIDGTIGGFEALARWPHPERGMIPPDTFIRIAEENGLILQMGEWALETACRTATSWAPPLTVAVNVSPVQFRFGDFPSTVERILAATNLPANRLEIEITEGVLIGDIERATTILARLTALGVRIALDDFGVGYSSLSYLHTLPFNKIKLDRSLMRDASEGSRSGMIVASIVELCHRLGMTVLAEGIEAEHQLEFLQSIGCDEAQGFLLGRPMPISEYRHLTNAYDMPVKSVCGG